MKLPSSNQAVNIRYAPGYFNQEHDRNNNNNNDNANSFTSLVSNCNDYSLKEINSSIKFNQTIHSIPDTLSIIKVQNTDQLLNHSPCRSSSLIRCHHHHQNDHRSSIKLNRSHFQHSDHHHHQQRQQQQQPYISNYPIEHLIDHDISLPYMPTLFSSDSKSSSLSKESGGKKILVS
ncbi:unnamed protein product [Schistosoma mattheei]|uniref:Uncharacterized protein n=1 Tax=Schistosoma mattheei TaxID=31246 RepID=A0A183PQA4_9TREM|nr:unnamed protein product [Schistosoma mattheei]